jgi:hypothetical protein
VVDGINVYPRSVLPSPVPKFEWQFSQLSPSVLLTERGRELQIQPSPSVQIARQLYEGLPWRPGALLVSAEAAIQSKAKTYSAGCPASCRVGGPLQYGSLYWVQSLAGSETSISAVLGATVRGQLFHHRPDPAPGEITYPYIGTSTLAKVGLRYSGRNTSLGRWAFEGDAGLRFSGGRAAQDWRIGFGLGY